MKQVPKRTPKTRLDIAIVERGLANSREKARAMLLAGKVMVSGKEHLKPGSLVSQDDEIIVKTGLAYVSRGGLKLSHALDEFGLETVGKIALDVGASAGGFTDCLLQRGAKKVYAVDVGYGQMDYRLRSDPRVMVLERVNARYPFDLPEIVDIVVIDVSFISLTKVLPTVQTYLKPCGLILALVKPQFEALRKEVGKGGIIKDPATHARVLGRIILWAIEKGWRLRGLTPSPILGTEGNREFFVLLKP